MQTRHVLIGVTSCGALGHVSPLDLQQFKFFRLLWICTKSDRDFLQLPLQTYLYFATAAVVVMLHSIELVRW